MPLAQQGQTTCAEMAIFMNQTSSLTTSATLSQPSLVWILVGLFVLTHGLLSTIIPTDYKGHPTPLHSGMFIMFAMSFWKHLPLSVQCCVYGSGTTNMQPHPSLLLALQWQWKTMSTCTTCINNSFMITSQYSVNPFSGEIGFVMYKSA